MAAVYFRKILLYLLSNLVYFCNFSYTGYDSDTFLELQEYVRDASLRATFIIMTHHKILPIFLFYIHINPINTIYYIHIWIELTLLKYWPQCPFWFPNSHYNWQYHVTFLNLHFFLGWHFSRLLTYNFININYLLKYYIIKSSKI